MITTERDVYTACHVTRAVKNAVETIAKNRGVSQSALIYLILAHSQEIKAITGDPPSDVKLIRRPLSFNRTRNSKKPTR